MIAALSNLILKFNLTPQATRVQQDRTVVLVLLDKQVKRENLASQDWTETSVQPEKTVQSVLPDKKEIRDSPVLLVHEEETVSSDRKVFQVRLDRLEQKERSDRWVDRGRVTSEASRVHRERTAIRDQTA